MDSLYQRLKEYYAEDFYPCHMPGHKRNPPESMPEELFEIDITEIDGFDNLHQPEGALRELQRRAARLYGSEESYYLVNGSTCGVLAAVSAALPVGGRLLMARNCHKSAYHAAYLRSLRISYLYPGILEEYNICESVTPGQVSLALARESDIGAVLVVSPTYEGRIADIAGIAAAVHAHGIPLIVDEAHGAHLGFCPELSDGSCRQGADYVIHSVHKTLPALTQTALLHVNGGLADRKRVRRFLSIYQTSSPSYPLMASIDAALREAERPELWEAFFRRWNRMRSRLAALKRLRILTDNPQRQDAGKLVIGVGNSGLSGKQIYDMLLQKYHLQLEMASERFCLAMLTVGDTEEGFERLTEALLRIDSEPPASAPGTKLRYERDFADLRGGEPPCATHSLSTAWDSPAEELPLEACAFRCAGEFIGLYPPGTPLVVPGEILTPDILRKINEYMDRGLNVQGVRQCGGKRLCMALIPAGRGKGAEETALRSLELCGEYPAESEQMGARKELYKI